MKMERGEVGGEGPKRTLLGNLLKRIRGHEGGQMGLL